MGHSSEEVPAMRPAARAEQQSCESTSITYVLFLIFGIGSWLTVNGIFTELPLLVQSLPEGWRLGSVLAVAVQAANLGPLLYFGLRKLALQRDPSGEREERLASFVTSGVLLLGALCMGLLALCWAETVSIGGKESSVPLILMTSVAALADCTSSLVFWPFASGFESLFVSALAAGEGLSGAVAAAVAWAQGASRRQPNFSPTVYFTVLALCMIASLVAYKLLQPRRPRREAGPNQQALELGLPLSGAPSRENSGVVAPVSSAGIVALLALQFYINVLQNGISVSCLGLAAKHYGREVYQLCQTLSLILDPLAAALGYRLRAGARALSAMALVLAVLFGYTIALSLEGVEPPLLDAGGGPLLVLVSVLGRMLCAYGKMRGNILLQCAEANGEASSLLMWSGASMQGGACIGSVVMFLLINFTDLFKKG